MREGRDICIQIADSLPCTPETNTALQSNYTPGRLYFRILKIIFYCLFVWGLEISNSILILNPLHVVFPNT